MTISSGDITFRASAVMTDDDEGGGAPVSTVIVDGTSNNVFGDISEVARAGGEVSLRKLFLSVSTGDTDTYLDANVVLSAVPSDDNVSAVIFEAEDFFETRTDAVDRLESYLSPSTLWAGVLMENHVVNQRSIQMFQRVGSTLPSVGQTLYLVQNEGASTQVAQYVRVKSVSSETKTFTYTQSSSYVDYDVLVVTCELTGKLASSFTGSSPNRTFTADSGAAKVRATQVADAVTCYGASSTTAAVVLGDTTVKVSSIYSRVVPSAQTETALVDLSAMGAVSPMVASSDSTVTRSVTIASIATGGRYVLPCGCMPGTLNLVTPSGTVTDDGKAGLLMSGASAGSITYSTGELAFTRAIGAGTVTETYQPAAAVSGQAYTMSREVTAENRAYVWVFSLLPLPAPGVLTLSYMAGGEWYELDDNGLGVLSGSDSSYGTGTLSYVTGSVSATLGALPDVGSEVMLSWGTQAECVKVSESSLGITQPKIEFELGEALDAGTLKLSWAAAGVTASATDNGAGSITGAASGSISYATGEGWIRPAVLPDAGTLAATYTASTAETYGTTVSAGTTITGTLPNAPLEAGSIVASVLISQAATDTDKYGYVASSSSVISGTIRDNGAGGWTLDDYGALPSSSINYTTGAYVIVLNVNTTTPVATYKKGTA